MRASRRRASRASSTSVPRLLRVLSAVGAGRLSQPRRVQPPEVSGTGIVTALTAEARTLGPVQRAPRSASGDMAIQTLSDGNLLVISGMGSAAAAQAALALVPRVRAVC